MDVKRWQLNGNAARTWLEEDDEGQWVSHADHVAHTKRLREALESISNARPSRNGRYTMGDIESIKEQARAAISVA